MKKFYPILVETSGVDQGNAYGIFFPDIPGCFSAADSYEEILDNAEQAAMLHIGESGEIPEPTRFSDMKGAAKFARAWARHFELEQFVLMTVRVDLSAIAGPAKRINVTIPEFTLAKIDAAAHQAGKSRSEFLAEAGLKAAG